MVKLSLYGQMMFKPHSPSPLKKDKHHCTILYIKVSVCLCDAYKMLANLADYHELDNYVKDITG